MKFLLNIILSCICVFAIAFTGMFLLGVVQIAHEWGYL